MTQLVARQCTVTGLVQGVFYRASTQKKAQSLGVTGWVRNLPNGDVEVFACGAAETVQSLVDWLWQGPPRARVTSVNVADAPCETHSEFVVLRD